MRFIAVFFFVAICMLDVAMHAPSTILAFAAGVGVPAVLAALYAVATK
jgi:hypothetical protein